MTPAARVQTAIEILDDYLAGGAVEPLLTGWARRSRYAGSGDRAAVRDHVFGALRNLRSFAALGGAMSGRGLMLGALRAAQQDPEALFTGARHAPAPLSDAERAGGHPPAPGAEELDLPDWLLPLMEHSLGPQAAPVARILKQRARVHLRVNARLADRETAERLLRDEDILTAPHPGAATALEVHEGARRIRGTRAYREGLVELQDGASQAAVEALPLRDGMRVLDFCAGGGGKTLAMGARARVALFAHDADAARMRDLPARAARARLEVELLAPGRAGEHGPFDLVLCDVPCSGSGAWRRSPEGKWMLTPERLAELGDIQAAILREAASLTAPDGVLAYMTCSVLDCENSAQADRFLDENPAWRRLSCRSWSLLDGTDGFFLAQFDRKTTG